jgi:hypothetical protein
MEKVIARIEQAVDEYRANLCLRPGARKDGRNPRFPYVPVAISTDRRGRHTDQIRGLAFATIEEAKEAAARYLQEERDDLVRRLSEGRFRALREQYGLPRELEDLEALARV